MIPYTSHFYLERKAGTEIHHLRLRLRWCGRELRLRLGFQVDPSGWSPDAQCCTPRSKHGPYRLSGQQINAEIVRWAEAARRVFSGYTAADCPAPRVVSAGLRHEMGLAQESASVADAYFEFMTESSVARSWSLSTWKKMKTHKRHLLEWPPFNSFSGFTKRNLTAFLAHLTGDLGMSNTTAFREIGYLRWFLYWADEQGYTTSSEWRSFRPRLKQPEKPVVFLTWDELMRVRDYTHPTAGHDLVRDLFLLQCFTGLRWSDVSELRWADVTPDAIRVTTQKTTDALTIELNKWSREVLDRQPKGAPTDRVFPRIPNQVANRYIKHICRECGIDAPVREVTFRGMTREDAIVPKWQLVSTHAGRRTFICNALALGVPPTMIMRWTGHKDYRSMSPYIGVAEEEKKKAMAAFDKL